MSLIGPQTGVVLHAHDDTDKSIHFRIFERYAVLGKSIENLLGTSLYGAGILQLGNDLLD